MNDFQFHSPETLDDALSLIREGGEAKFLAGGQSLIPVMKLDLAQPETVVSLSRIPALKGIRSDDDTVEIGAGMSHAAVADSEVVQERIPALADLARTIGDPQVRNRGTLGGSLAHNDPAADYPAAILALGGTVVTDRREISADEYFQGMFATALEPDEIITAVRLPVPERACYAKAANPASRYALAGVFVAAGSDGVRVAVTGAGPGVFRMTEMEEALASDFSAGALEGIDVDPTDLLTDDAASAEYRAHLVGVMARRAVAGCA